jgi:hypothetical protein
MKLILLLQLATINENIKNAPNNGYLIGVWIGYILPFTVLVGLAYLMYAPAKKTENNL